LTSSHTLFILALMSPEIIISPSEGENFPKKKVHVSMEALTAAAPAIIMSDINLLTGEKTVSPEASKELDKLAVAMADAVRGS
jgi:hypothetical protein